MGYGAVNAPGSTPPTAAVIADAVWDELTADHVIADSSGQSQHMIRNQAIAGSTLDSLYDKIRGATTGQAFASAGMTNAEDSARFCLAASATVDFIPAAGETDFCSVLDDDNAGNNIRHFAYDGVNDHPTQPQSISTEAGGGVLMSTPTIYLRIRNADGASAEIGWRTIATFT